MLLTLFSRAVSRHDLSHQRVVSRTNGRCSEMPTIRLTEYPYLYEGYDAFFFFFWAGPPSAGGGKFGSLRSLDLSRQVGWPSVFYFFNPKQFRMYVEVFVLFFFVFVCSLSPPGCYFRSDAKKAVPAYLLLYPPPTRLFTCVRVNSLAVR